MNHRNDSARDVGPIFSAISDAENQQHVDEEDC